MTRSGRRPGPSATRADIVAAARAAFAEVGYDRASLRAIARRAGVDPALVHHYFDGKAALFVEVLQLARDPAEVVAEMNRSAGRPGRGAALARAFLELWEPRSPGIPSTFVATVQAVAASPEAADGLRQFLVDRVWSRVAGDEPPEEGALRRSLVAAQLFGLAWNRYILRLDPFASATVDDVAAWVGPTLDAYMGGPLPSAAGVEAERRGVQS